MRFLVDENLPPAVALALSRRGHDVLHIRGREIQGLRDEVIWQRAAEEQRILITRDLDFPLTQEPRPVGLVLVRLPHRYVSPQVARRVEEWVRNQSLESLSHRTTVVLAADQRVQDWIDA